MADRALNVLFPTQTQSLRAFWQVATELERRDRLGNAGFIVSGSEFYRTFDAETPDFAKRATAVIKEWDWLDDAAQRTPDLARLRELERRYGEPTLWNAIVSDRRLTWGKAYGLRLDYKPRFTYEQSLSITEQCFTRVEGLFDVVQPDVVVNFISTTIGDYAAWRVAHDRGIPFLNLRPSRIENCVTLADSPLEPSGLARGAYDALRQGADGPRKEAQDVLARMREGRTYEGTVGVAGGEGTSVANASRTRTRRLDHAVRRLLEQEARLRKGAAGDHHLPGAVYPLLDKRLARPARVAALQRQLAKHYVTPDELRGFDYAFFPLHMEPEVTLLVYSRPYRNQIEVARAFAENLPVGMRLVIKEHPAAMGKRAFSYYEKLLAIPNVELVPVATKAADVIDRAELVTTICGSVGLEALVRGKPVVTLGHTPYEFLPASMHRRVAEPDRLGHEIRDLLDTHSHDEAALEDYIASVLQTSVRLNWYTGLLGREGNQPKVRDAGVQGLTDAVEQAARRDAAARPNTPPSQ